VFFYICVINLMGISHNGSYFHFSNWAIHIVTFCHITLICWFMTPVLYIYIYIYIYMYMYSHTKPLQDHVPSILRVSEWGEDSKAVKSCCYDSFLRVWSIGSVMQADYKEGGCILTLTECEGSML
jgi:hypothetical protein